MMCLGCFACHVNVLGVEVDLQLEAEPNRKQGLLRGTATDKAGERAFIFTDGEDVAGIATIGVLGFSKKGQAQCGVVPFSRDNWENLVTRCSLLVLCSPAK